MMHIIPIQTLSDYKGALEVLFVAFLGLTRNHTSNEIRKRDFRIRVFDIFPNNSKVTKALKSPDEGATIA